MTNMKRAIKIAIKKYFLFLFLSLFIASPSYATGSSAEGWANEGVDFTFSGTDINHPTRDTAMYTTETFKGDFTFEAIFQSTTSDHCILGFFHISEDAEFLTNNARGGVFLMDDGWYVRADGGVFYVATSQATITPDTTSVLKFERVGNTIKFYQGGVLRHTYTQTTSSEVRLFVGGGIELSPAYLNVNWGGVGQNENFLMVMQ